MDDGRIVLIVGRRQKGLRSGRYDACSLKCVVLSMCARRFMFMFTTFLRLKKKKKYEPWVINLDG